MMGMMGDTASGSAQNPGGCFASLITWNNLETHLMNFDFALQNTVGILLSNERLAVTSRLVPAPSPATSLFLTFRLADSLPTATIARLRARFNAETLPEAVWNSAANFVRFDQRWMKLLTDN
jgi:hypothetical protein